MKLLCGFTLLLLVAAVAGITSNPGNFVAREIFDDFTVGFNQALFTVVTGTTFPINRTSIYTDPGNPAKLLGGERDILLSVENGINGRTMSTSVSNGEWEVATPNGASGFVILQLDGKDNDANNVATNNFVTDLTVGGTSQAFNISLETDIATEFTFSIYSPAGGACENTVAIPDGEGITINYYVRFDEFSAGCDFTQVAAIEIFVEAFDNVDALCKFFGTVGEPVSPSPRPSGTPTPTSTPAPSIDVCRCQCPAFTCAIDFDLDDDENDAFYFDDDDNGYGGASGNGQQVSAASPLSVSVAVVIAAVVALIY